jgi:hypothetical protein
MCAYIQSSIQSSMYIGTMYTLFCNKILKALKKKFSFFLKKWQCVNRGRNFCSRCGFTSGAASDRTVVEDLGAGRGLGHRRDQPDLVGTIRRPTFRRLLSSSASNVRNLIDLGFSKSQMNKYSIWETLPWDWEVRGHCMCK